LFETLNLEYHRSPQNLCFLTASVPQGEHPFAGTLPALSRRANRLPPQAASLPNDPKNNQTSQLESSSNW